MRLSKKPVEKTFTKDFGGDKPASITVRQANIGDITKRNGLLSESSLVLNDELLGQEIKQDINYYELFRFEVFLTLTAANFEDEDTGESYFTFVNGRLRDQAAFEKAWNAMTDIEVADWIHECVVEVNPQWSRQVADAGE